MSSNKGNTAQAAGRKAGAAQSPQDTAGKVLKTGQGYVVAPGHSFQTKAGHLTEGAAVTLETFKTAKDETGKAEFKRQLEKGAIVSGKVRAADTDAAAGAAGAGAGPSGAQLTAADSGDDPDATKVVDAALTGNTDDLEAANGAGDTTDKTGQDE